MPKGYVVLTEAIHDREGIGAYARASLPTLLEYGAKLLVLDENVERLEGSWHGDRTVIVEFESVAMAQKWYNSDDYQAVLPMRTSASECNVVILTGHEQV